MIVAIARGVKTRCSPGAEGHDHVRQLSRNVRRELGDVVVGAVGQDCALRVTCEISVWLPKSKADELGSGGP